MKTARAAMVPGVYPAAEGEDLRRLYREDERQAADVVVEAFVRYLELPAAVPFAPPGGGEPFRGLPGR